jgi:hypothetical protein
MTCSPTQVDDLVRFVKQGLANNLPAKKLLEMVPAECRAQVMEGIKGSDVSFEPKVPVGPVGTRQRAAWDHKFNSSEGPLWLQLRKYHFDVLKREPNDVAQLDKASDKVLFLLGDPSESGKNLESVKGLVVGYVQSGKTANYTALSAKAFDAGYKIVIVLSGIHNALRRQTQIRLENELGVIASTPDRLTASAIAPSGFDAITRITTDDLTTGDFKYSNIQNNVLGKGRSLFVTKKNASVLAKLIDWIGNSALDVPTLIIDDEADQATINTKNGVTKAEYEAYEGDQPSDIDIDPTRINELVRTLVKKFNNVSYVGYTATPYANVFIPFDDTHSVVGDELYPKDFILSLPKPNNYMGPEDFFGTQMSGEKGPADTENVIQIVPSEEAGHLDQLGSMHEGQASKLPEMLKAAIRAFILATAAKRTFDGHDGPSSMLIHASHLKEKQGVLAEHVQAYIDSLRNNWRYSKDEFISEWQAEWQAFVEDMEADKFKFEFLELEPSLDLLLGKYSPLPVLELNSASDDELDYEKTPNLTAIIIGGNKLSRGLTLEGLLVSYFVRKASSPKADTLTQMGRFFGYRKPVIEITRLYTTDDLRNAFIDVSLVEEALRREIAEYEKTGKSPADFAPRVLMRAGLLPTDKKKMKSAKAGGTSYSGDLVQTTSFPMLSEVRKSKPDAGKSKLELNRLAAVKLFRDLTTSYGDGEVVGTKLNTNSGANVRAQIRWKNVNFNHVVKFLTSYNAVEGATRFVPASLATYITDLADEPGSDGELTKWTVAIAGRLHVTELGIETFDSPFSFGRVERSLVVHSESSIGVLVNPLDIQGGTGDELLDFDKVDIEQMKTLKQSNAGQDMKSSEIVRNARPKTRGLLVIYPISPNSKGVEDSTAIKGKRADKTIGQVLFSSEAQDPTIIGAAISFPVSEVDHSMRKHWAQNMNKGRK